MRTQGGFSGQGRGGRVRNSSKYLATIRGIPAPISTGSRRNDNRFRESVKRGVKCIRARYALYDILHIYYKCKRRADFLIFLLLKSCRVENDPLPHTVEPTCTYLYFYKQKIFIIKTGVYSLGPRSVVDNMSSWNVFSVKRAWIVEDLHSFILPLVECLTSVWICDFVPANRDLCFRTISTVLLPFYWCKGSVELVTIIIKIFNSFIGVWLTWYSLNSWSKYLDT